MNTNNHTAQIAEMRATARVCRCDNAVLVAELRSAAKTLRVEGIGNTRTHMLAAELIDRAADALATAYTPAQMAESFRAGLATARMEPPSEPRHGDEE